MQSIPHTPQQNGRAERFNRTISDKAQAMRFQAHLPESYWEFATSHAVYIYNRTPMACHNFKTPYELLNKSKPDISNIRVFGCGAYVYLPEDVRNNKLSPKAEMMVYLGTADGIKGHKFIRSTSNIIFYGTTAKFDEQLFPRDTTKPRAPNFTTEEQDSSTNHSTLDNPTIHKEIPQGSASPDEIQDRRRSRRQAKRKTQPNSVYGDKTPLDIL